jgi:hypothetical protein
MYVRFWPCSVPTLGSRTQGKAWPNSGSPGYRRGAMVRAAVPGGTGALQVRGAGISLLSPALFTGACMATNALARPVLFGSDSASECAIELTLAQLRQFCQKRPAALLPDSTIPLPQYYTDLPAELHLAIWGDSDPSISKEWVQILYEQAGLCLHCIHVDPSADTVRILSRMCCF